MINTKSAVAPPPVSVTEPARYTPDALRDREPPPVFLLKVPTVRDKVQFETAIELEGLRYPQDAEIYAALKSGIIEQVVDAEQPALLQIIDEAEAAQSEGNPLGEELAGHIEQISQALRPFHVPLQRLLAERRRWLGMVCVLRTELLLIGLDGEAPLPRWQGKVTSEAIDAIELRFGNGTVYAIGNHTFTMTTPTEDERKNSELPEPSPLDHEISTAEPRPRTNRSGKSSVNGSALIPA